MKLCKDCKYFSEYHGVQDCNAPQNGFSCVDGTAISRSPLLNRGVVYERVLGYKACGPEGQFWEAKSKPFWKFWSK